MSKVKIDPVCLVHGKRMSKHLCLYCCLCFKPLTPEECNVREDGVKEDVCKLCAKKEKMVRCKDCSWCISSKRGLYTFCFLFDKDCLEQTGTGYSHCGAFAPRKKLSSATLWDVPISGVKEPNEH